VRKWRNTIFPKFNERAKSDEMFGWKKISKERNIQIAGKAHARKRIYENSQTDANKIQSFKM